MGVNISLILPNIAPRGEELTCNFFKQLGVLASILVLTINTNTGILAPLEPVECGRCVQLFWFSVFINESLVHHLYILNRNYTLCTFRTLRLITHPLKVVTTNLLGRIGIDIKTPHQFINIVASWIYMIQFAPTLMKINLRHMIPNLNTTKSQI